MGNGTSDEALLAALREGDRAALGKAITLVESTRAEDRERAVELVEHARANAGRSLRIGITGIPGVGKSTLIDPLGLEAIAHGHRVAVLATDPSSARSHGSILGDKTRMEDLSRSESAFVRPTPSSGTLGGVARRTQEVIVLCEAAGYDVIIIETVGVGQSELEVDRMTDLNVLLTIPGTGDELQGIKRGVMESADVIVLNKAGETGSPLYAEARRSLLNAVAYLPARESGLRPDVLLADGLSGLGVSSLWTHIDSLSESSKTAGYFDRKRGEQNVQWLHNALRDGLERMMMDDPRIKEQLRSVQEPVQNGKLGPFKAATDLLVHFKKDAAHLP